MGAKALFTLTPAMVLGVLIVFRIANAFFLRTAYNPDEFWQGPEVSHWLVTGRGHLTWEWLYQLRSFVHPLLVAAPLWLLSALGIRSPYAWHHGPRVVQSIASAIGEWYTVRLTHREFGAFAAGWTLFFQLTSFYHFFTMPRTLSNCLEAAVMQAAVYYFFPTPYSRPGPRSSKAPGPAAAQRSATWVSMLLCAFAFIIRPTSAIMWLFMLLSAARHMPWTKWFRFLAVYCFPPVAAAVAVSLAIDRAMYGGWAFVPFNFFKFNFLEGASEQYGEHSVLFYAFAILGLGGPLLHIPLGWLKASEEKRKHILLFVWTILWLSLSPHKEPRFLLPAVPVLYMYAGAGFVQGAAMFKECWQARHGRSKGKESSPAASEVQQHRDTTELATATLRNRKMKPSSRSRDRSKSTGMVSPMDSDAAAAAPPLPSRRGAMVRWDWRSLPWLFKLLAFLTWLIHSCVAYYFAQVHQSGTIAASLHVGELLKEHNGTGVVHFLLPCHSTPYYSAIHGHHILVQPDCSPKTFMKKRRPKLQQQCDEALALLKHSPPMCHGALLYEHLATLPVSFDASTLLACIASSGTYSVPRLSKDWASESDWLMKDTAAFLSAAYGDSSGQFAPHPKRKEACPWPGKWRDTPDVIVTVSHLLQDIQHAFPEYTQESQLFHSHIDGDKHNDHNNFREVFILKRPGL